MPGKGPPLPEITPEGRPFWEACSRGELVCQRCTACIHYRFPPLPACPKCHGHDFRWEKLSGKGTIASWSVTRVPKFASTPPVAFSGFEDRIPFIIVAVELAEQPGLRMVSNLVDAAPEELDIGKPVEVVFHRLTPEIALPYFRLVR